MNPNQRLLRKGKSMTIHRRQFLGTTLGAAAAMTVARRVGAADTAGIRVAQIGFNGQGSGHLRTLNGLGDYVVALCDVDEHVLQGKVDEYKEKRDRKVEAFTDYRKLLDWGKFDAVSIATPNHSHAMLTIAAVQAG